MLLLRQFRESVSMALGGQDVVLQQCRIFRISFLPVYFSNKPLKVRTYSIGTIHCQSNFMMAMNFFSKSLIPSRIKVD